MIAAGLKVAGSESSCELGVAVPATLVAVSLLSQVHPPLAIVRGVNGAAFAAWEDIAALLPGTERVAGVNEGDSTFKLFLSLGRHFLPMSAKRSLKNSGREAVLACQNFQETTTE